MIAMPIFYFYNLDGALVFERVLTDCEIPPAFEASLKYNNIKKTRMYFNGVFFIWLVVQADSDGVLALVRSDQIFESDIVTLLKFSEA